MQACSRNASSVLSEVETTSATMQAEDQEALKARHLAESGTSGPLPVRRSRTFKEGFTVVAIAYIAYSLVGAAINVAVEGRETRQMYNDCMRRRLNLETIDMYKLRQ